jgi:hypothetical protein
VPRQVVAMTPEAAPQRECDNNNRHIITTAAPCNAPDILLLLPLLCDGGVSLPHLSALTSRRCGRARRAPGAAAADERQHQLRRGCCTLT